jgi:hypothetical protein
VDACTLVVAKAGQLCPQQHLKDEEGGVHMKAATIPQMPIMLAMAVYTLVWVSYRALKKLGM